MRRLFLSLLVLASASAPLAHAGAFEKCRLQETEASGLRTCIEAERNHAANLLRGQNIDAMATVQKKVRVTRNKALLKRFRADQAHHVRVRERACRKQPSKNEKVACEADMDYAQAEKLKRYTDSQAEN